MQKNAGKSNEKEVPLPEDMKRSYLPYICTFQELENKYEVKRELGRGSYGVAYKIVDKAKPTQKYALKRLFAITQARWILLEILYLKLLYGKQNIIKYITGIRKDSQVDIIFEYVPHQPFAYLIDQMKLSDVKHYMYQLLKAISVLDSYGIMHRDIKPTNFLYSTKTKSGRLIDFGLSELTNNAVDLVKDEADKTQIKRISELQRLLSAKNRAGTRGYIPLETILKEKNQTTAVDIWAAGVIFLSLLAQRHPIFSLNSTSKVKSFVMQNLLPITYIFGSDDVKTVCYELGYGYRTPERIEKLDLSKLITRELDNSDPMDLLNKMLTLRACDRIKASAALKHKFFDEVRREYEK